MTITTKNFEIGKTYVVQSRCDRVFFKVVARTVKTATFELIGTQHDASRFDEMHIDIAGNGETQKVRLRTDDGVEFGTVQVEAQNSFGIHFTNRVNIEAKAEVQVSIAAEKEIEEVMITPLVSTAAQAVAVDAEIALATVNTDETVNETDGSEDDPDEETVIAVIPTDDSELDDDELIDEPTGYWAERANGNYSLFINDEYVTFKNHSIVLINASKKLGMTYEKQNGRKYFYTVAMDSCNHHVIEHSTRRIAAAKVADIYAAKETAHEQDKIFPAFFKPYQNRPTGEFTIWVMLTYADGSEHHFRGEFEQYRLTQKFIADVKNFVGDMPCQFVTKTRDHYKDEKPVWVDPHKYETAGNLDASHYLAVRYNYLHDEKTNQPDDIANLCVINGQKVSADEYVQYCKDIIASNEPIRVEAWFGMKKALAADDYETHDDWLDDYCDADAIIQECLANIKTVTGVTVPDDKSYLDNEFCLEKQTADNPTVADDFMTELAKLKAQADCVQAEYDAAQDAVLQAYQALAEAKDVVEEADEKYSEAIRAYRQYGELKAQQLFDQFITDEVTLTAGMTIHTQGAQVLTPEILRPYLCFFEDKFIISGEWVEYGSYETPAQIEAVMTRLKNAIARGDKEFTFPTVDELKTPPPTVDDKLGRAMETALLKCQEQCRNGNINAALAELKTFAICRDAARELNTLPEPDFTPLPKRITAYHDDSAIIPKVEETAMVRSLLIDDLNKKITDIEDDISFNQLCFDETDDASTLDAELKTLVTNGMRLIKQRDKLLAHVNYLNGILTDVILNNADLEQKIA